MALNKDDKQQPKPQTAMGQAMQAAGMSVPPGSATASPQLSATQPKPEPAQATTQQTAGSVGTNNYSNQKSTNIMQDINSLISRDVSKNALSGNTAAYIESFKKVLDKVPQQARDMYQIHAMENGQVGTWFSSLLFCKAVSSGGQPIVAVYCYQIEASASKLQNRQVQIGGANYSIPTVPGDAIDGTLWSKTEQFLKSVYGAEARIINAGVQPVWTETVPTDDSKIAYLVVQAANATSTALVTNGIVQEQPLDVKLLTTGGQPVTGIDWNPAPKHDLQGLPVRSDLRIVTRKPNDQTSATTWAPNSNRNEDIVATDVYVDVDYSPQQPQNPYGFNPQAAQQSLQRYVPRAVITGVESLIDAMTLEIALLGILQTTVLSRNNTFLQAFAPRWPTAKKERNLRDATAFGLEVNLMGGDKPARLPHPSQQELGSYYQMLALAISPNVLYSIDVSEAGDDTWYTRDLFLASQGITEGYQNIVKAMDRLTDGRFSAMWDNSPIAIDENVRIPNGYWIDDNGERQDIRKLDYLAMLNIVGEKDMALVHDWSNTKYQVNEPLELRLERQDRIQREILGGYTLKSFSRRLVLSAKFISVGAQALAAAGLMLQSNDSLVDLSGQTIRGNFNTVSQALDFNAAGIGMFAGAAGGNYNTRGGVGYGGLGYNAGFGR
jgi:hypothetical protein